MQFTPFLLLATAAGAFTIPEGQPDGVYQVQYIDGQETHTLLHLSEDPRPRTNTVGSPTSAKFARAQASKRQIGGGSNGISCGGAALNAGDTDAANNALDAQCGGGTAVPGGDDFYSIAGCTVAYFCNFRSYADECFASERQSVSAAITADCGLYYSGWDTFVSTGGAGRWNSYGYENFCGTGDQFCGRGTTGKL